MNRLERKIAPWMLNITDPGDHSNLDKFLKEKKTELKNTWHDRVHFLRFLQDDFGRLALSYTTDFFPENLKWMVTHVDDYFFDVSNLFEFFYMPEDMKNALKDLQKEEAKYTGRLGSKQDVHATMINHLKLRLHHYDIVEGVLRKGLLVRPKINPLKDWQSYDAMVSTWLDSLDRSRNTLFEFFTGVQALLLK